MAVSQQFIYLYSQFSRFFCRCLGLLARRPPLDRVIAKKWGLPYDGAVSREEGMVMAQKTIWKGRWNEIKGKAKQTWGNVTDDDLMYQEGKEEEVIGRIQRKTGETAEDIRRRFDDWAR
jgi:uncharacterized protein YjbJ (UPF0337 family)